MKNKKSYTEIMKSRNTMNKEQSENPVLDMYIQMILDEALFNRQKALLEEKINDALDRSDRSLFQKLAKQYAKLREIG
ncbi:IDEAL domain-containing protein [Metabacillus herbersteinensis]|uniref:IDEAL domain-containing protein n=1 Tax=Metabacillus herbersteinensis TaxID=283816 RepID=A0ABV6GLK3_9BACI